MTELFNEAAIASRRLYPNWLGDKKKAEARVQARSNKVVRPNQVYIFFYEDPEPIIFYVGCTFDPTRRFKEHRDAIQLGVDLKSAYIFARDILVKYGHDSVKMEVIDAAGDRSEHEWREDLIALGHPLQNDAECIDVRRAQRKQKKQGPIKHCAEFLRVMEKNK